jgi:hypothetical protein
MGSSPAEAVPPKCLNAKTASSLPPGWSFPQNLKLKALFPPTCALKLTPTAHITTTGVPAVRQYHYSVSALAKVIVLSSGPPGPQPKIKVNTPVTFP